MMISAQDMYGGLQPEKDLVFPRQPSDPEMRESVSMWLFEENGAFAFPRMGIEAEASSWEDRRYQANFAFDDGRVVVDAGRGPAPPPMDAQGRPAILGAGPLAFQCIEPFRRWTATFDGSGTHGHVSQQIARTLDPAHRKTVKLQVEMMMATPAVVHGTLDDELQAKFMGKGYRIEHLFCATGTFEFDGQTRPFKGTGVRVHRQSVRQLEGFWGHCWQSALFPDGRAFWFMAYPPRGEGPPSFSDAYIYQVGRMIPARIARPPWLRRVVPRGDDVSFELESELGTTRIEGVTQLSTFRIGNPDMMGLNLQQGGARYTWDGQTAYGMIERSAHDSQITIG